MDKTSLFAYIISAYSHPAENIASDSLHFILKNSKTAKEAFIDYLRKYGVEVSGEVDVRKQKQDIQKNQPDLTINVSGGPVVYIEAKFGADLTQKQPVGYWQHLSENANSLLLFIVPSYRLGTLWNELVPRLKTIEPQLHEQENTIVFPVGFPNRKMSITTWDDLLEYLLAALEEKGEKEAASDVYQLRMLCRDKDYLESDINEIESKNGPHHKLVNSINDWLKNDCKAIASKKGLTLGRGWNYYAQYIRIHGVICGIYYHPGWQKKYVDTPLWFWIGTGKLVGEITYPEYDGVIIPLMLEANGNHDENLSVLKVRILEIAQKLAPEVE